MTASLEPLMGRTHRLVVFDAVVRTGSFTAAGQALDVSQPAVSRQIAILEDQLQAELFFRERNRVILTAAGETLHKHVEQAFDVLDAAQTELRGQSDELTLALQPAIADSWFSPRLDELRSALAPTTVRLVIFDHDDELDDLSHDVSIRFGTGFGRRSLRSRLLISESVIPVAAPDVAKRHGLGAESDPAALLDGPPLLQVEHERRDWLRWDQWFGAQGLDWQPPTDEIVHRNYAMLVQQALSGRGVVLGWETLLGDLVSRGMLTPVGPRVDRPDWGYWMVWPAGLTRHAGRRRLVEWTEATVTSLQSSADS